MSSRPWVRIPPAPLLGGVAHRSAAPTTRITNARSSADEERCRAASSNLAGPGFDSWWVCSKTPNNERRTNDGRDDEPTEQPERYSLREIKMTATVDIAQLRRTVDELARDRRELDVALQAANWANSLAE